MAELPPVHSGTILEHRGYRIELRGNGEWVAAISRPDGGGLATSTTASLEEGRDVCAARATEIIDTYLTYLLDASDDAGPHASGPEDFDSAVRDTAYFLWEQDGRPEGRSDEYWQRALDQHMRARAYSIWLAEGQPEGRAEDNWNAARNPYSWRS